MLIILLSLIFVRPFICSLAYLSLNYAYSITLLAFLIFWLVHNYREPPFKRLNHIKYPLVLFCLAVIISVSFSVNKVNSLGELYKYAGGLLLLVISASLEEKNKGYLIYSITSCALIISILAIYQFLFGFKSLSSYVIKQQISDPFVLDYISRKRVFFPFVTPNILGGYLAMIIPLCFTHKYKVLFIAPMSIALILTKSMGALLVLYIGLAAYFYLSGMLKTKQILFLLGILITIILTFALRTFIQKEHTQPLFSTLTRFNYWLDTLAVIVKSPITGTGLGNFNLAQSRYAHNSYLQVWAEMGILGAASFVWLILSVLRAGKNYLRASSEKNQIAGLLAANSIFLLHNFIDFTFFLPEVALIWWAIAGLLISFEP